MQEEIKNRAKEGKPCIHQASCDDVLDLKHSGLDETCVF